MDIVSGRKTRLASFMPLHQYCHHHVGLPIHRNIRHLEESPASRRLGLIQAVFGAESNMDSTSQASVRLALRPRLVAYSSSDEEGEDVEDDGSSAGEREEQAVEVCLNPCKHHPTSLKNAMVDDSAHLETLQTFADDLNRGLRGVFPTQEIPYKRVLVLLLCWEKDDVNFFEFVKEIEGVFKHDFKYDTDLYRIPLEDSHNQLEYKLVDTKKEISSRTQSNLLILFYGGHGVCVFLRANVSRVVPTLLRRLRARVHTLHQLQIVFLIRQH